MRLCPSNPRDRRIPLERGRIARLAACTVRALCRFNTAANWTPATVPTGTAFFNAPNVASIEPDDTSIVFDHDCQLGLEEIA